KRTTVIGTGVSSKRDVITIPRDAREPSEAWKVDPNVGTTGESSSGVYSGLPSSIEVDEGSSGFPSFPDGGSGPRSAPAAGGGGGSGSRSVPAAGGGSGSGARSAPAAGVENGPDSRSASGGGGGSGSRSAGVRGGSGPRSAIGGGSGA